MLCHGTMNNINRTTTDRGDKYSLSPLILPGFVNIDNYDRRVLYHPKSGEMIFGVGKDGDVAHVDRRYSFWTRPTDPYTCAQEMRRHCVRMHEAERSWIKQSRQQQQEEKQQQQQQRNPPSSYDTTTTTTTNSNGPNYVRSEEEEGLLGYYGPRVGRQIAVRRLQLFVRLVLAKVKTRTQVLESFEKRFDREQGFFYFVHMVTGQTQWHRPWGLGRNNNHYCVEYDVPETVSTLPTTIASSATTNSASSSSSAATTSGRTKIANQSQINMIRCDHDAAVTLKLRKMDTTIGPYFVREKNQPSSRAKRTFTTPFVPNSGDGEQKYVPISVQKESSHIVNYPHELPLTLGSTFHAFDGFRLLKEPPPVVVDPYTLLRSAYERGVDCVLRVINTYYDNKHVVCFGCIALAKCDCPEEEDTGLASSEARRVPHETPHIHCGQACVVS